MSMKLKRCQCLVFALVFNCLITGLVGQIKPGPFRLRNSHQTGQVRVAVRNAPQNANQVQLQEFIMPIPMLPRKPGPVRIRPGPFRLHQGGVLPGNTDMILAPPISIRSEDDDDDDDKFTVSVKTKSPFSGVCAQYMSTDGGLGYYPHVGSCTQYIHCDQDGRGFIETCAAGTFFNGRKCVMAQNVLCSNDPCHSMSNGERYSDGQTCFGYFQCLNGQSVSGHCPEGTSFQAIGQTCVQDYTCAQLLDLKNPCSSGTTLPFPGQPHKFYLWDGHDGMHEMSCPRGLWYNPHVCTCDWVIPGESKALGGCTPMFHFSYNGNFLERGNKVPQSPNGAVSIYKKAAVFDKGGEIQIWMMSDLDMDSEWALCFEFLTQSRVKGEVALLSNDWQGAPFTYKITHVPLTQLVIGYFRMKDGTVVELIVTGVDPNVPHFLRLAKLGSVMEMRIDNMPPAVVAVDAGVSSSPAPMVIGSASGCHGFQGFFDELKFFRCIPEAFFSDY